MIFNSPAVDEQHIKLHMEPTRYYQQECDAEDLYVPELSTFLMYRLLLTCLFQTQSIFVLVSALFKGNNKRALLTYKMKTHSIVSTSILIRAIYKFCEMSERRSRPRHLSIFRGR